MSASEIRLSIGQLSERSGLTRRALRLLDRNGVLVPLRAENGYRFYSEKQATLASIIHDLRSAGLSSSAIAELMAVKIGDIPTRRKFSAFMTILAGAKEELMKKRAAIDSALHAVEGFEEQCRVYFRTNGGNDD
jgi:DNA-binding transcriptional MerR regulator